MHSKKNRLWVECIVYKVATLLAAAVAFASAEHGNAYSYNHFEGPVSGPVHKITVPLGLKDGDHDGQHAQAFDYVAKPDYKFAYGVEDPHRGNSQRRKESRDGDKVQGEYSLIEPDGSLRVVKYTADLKNGFQAIVQHTPSHASGYKQPTVTKYLVSHRPNEGAAQEGGHQQYQHYHVQPLLEQVKKQEQQKSAEVVQNQEQDEDDSSSRQEEEQESPKVNENFYDRESHESYATSESGETDESHHNVKTESPVSYHRIQLEEESEERVY
ncbi:uncharacterized protein LOC113375712 [Ctenocephalides felis]|uniref:uncharacterized protein LOC113375712 n=1 Tax=Ctenocephalides felis TaxID=7515 RepID=UPI000E6E1A52|nr:uncharacterized protein LOC113375712 [Ctenocephalides felis]